MQFIVKNDTVYYMKYVQRSLPQMFSVEGFLSLFNYHYRNFRAFRDFMADAAHYHFLQTV